MEVHREGRELRQTGKGLGVVVVNGARKRQRSRTDSACRSSLIAATGLNCLSTISHALHFLALPPPPHPFFSLLSKSRTMKTVSHDVVYMLSFISELALAGWRKARIRMLRTGDKGCDHTLLSRCGILCENADFHSFLNSWRAKRR